ncbi:MAG TPA: MCE family protein [Acidimicrobiales bacterium]|nr:MCE family protein [Acidimicrobiales bacterium]
MIKVAVKFGLFVVVCLAFTGYLAFMIGNIDPRDPFGRDTYTLTARFDDVTGLIPDDNVKVAGVVVGKVTSVRTDRGQAVVTFRVDRDHGPIPRDTTAAVRWRNLIGQRYLYLYPGTSSQALEDGDEITETTSVVDLGAIFDRLGPIVGAIDPTQVNEFLETITQALDGREDVIGDALDDLATLMTGLASRDDAIQRLITNLDTVADTINARDAQIAAMLENLITLADAFGDNTATLDAALHELGTFGAELDALLTSSSDEIDRLLANLALVTDTVEGRLPQLDTVLANLAGAGEALARAGNRGEFLSQKILCPYPGPPSSSEAGCPLGAPITGLGAAAQPFTTAPTSGAAAITSLLAAVVQP